MTKITKQRFFVMSERKSPFPSLSSPDILILGRQNNGSDGETQKTCARVSDPGSWKPSPVGWFCKLALSDFEIIFEFKL